jgi:hypothetical protein
MPPDRNLKKSNNDQASVTAMCKMAARGVMAGSLEPGGISLCSAKGHKDMPETLRKEVERAGSARTLQNTRPYGNYTCQYAHNPQHAGVR